MKVAVSGARGFVGRSLMQSLLRENAEPIALVRTVPRAPYEFAVGDLAEDAPLALPRMDALVHLAARVHVMDERAAHPLDAYRRVNVRGTERLLEGARRAGAKRFVFVSTIKVLGEETPPGCTFAQDAQPAPRDPYAVSKFEAEGKVVEFCEKHGMEWSIVRPVLVHGPEVGGNFAQMLRLIARQLPLPLGGIRNARSLVFVGNLGDFLAAATHHPYLARRTVNLADQPALSTPDLIRLLADAMDRRVPLLPVPAKVLEFIAAIAGQGDRVRRLTRSLHVDSSQVFHEMQWQPPVSQNEALQKTVAGNVRSR